MFGWIRRIVSIFTNKVDSFLDRFEDPKIALETIIRDMNTEIQENKSALSNSEIQAKRSRISQGNFALEAQGFRRQAERCMDENNEYSARQMLRRAVEAEKASKGFADAADTLEMDMERLRNAIRLKELKHQEAKGKKHSLLAQKRVSESLSRLNKSSYSEGSSAFTEYERITEKIADQSAEAETSFAMSSELGSHSDVVMLEASVENELEDLKKKMGKVDVPQLEHKQDF